MTWLAVNTKIVKFKPNAFDDNSEKYWHVLGDGRESDRILCGAAEEGDTPDFHEDGQILKSKPSGRVTCPTCVAIILFCKNIRAF
jgi:hypothetical protein